ncbi:MAG: allantoinase AllB [Spirochaetaceae bacterium]|nr:MAG: allantoinase AllB [Spirochaetaceae bacterium]
MVDLLLRGATVLSAGREPVTTDIAIEHGLIVDTDADPGVRARQTIDAAGLHAMPGVIDTHVHFNEPGRSDWEGVATGSAAAAAGGVTLFADMPLNSDPPLLDAATFGAKHARCRRLSLTDFALWAGLTPESLPHMRQLAGLGAIGFKAFMCNSGIPEFRAADDATLYQGMQTAAELDLPVAVHAENDSITAYLGELIRMERTVTDARDFLESRPVVAEVEAAGRAITLAEATGCRLHIVHVSCGRVVDLVSAARARGVDVSCETCAHYLHFCDDDVARLGPVAKCAPPIRDLRQREELWRAVDAGEIDFVASDHSPAPAELKLHPDFFSAWGGIAGVQSTLSVMLTGAKARGIGTGVLVRCLSTAPGDRYRLPRKGRIEAGYDADIVLVEPESRDVLSVEQLLSRHRLSPYLGEAFVGKLRRTILRGRTIYLNGAICSEPTGRLVRPASQGDEV